MLTCPTLAFQDEQVSGESCHRYRSSRDIHSILDVITALLRKGEKSAITVLNTVCEQWLERLTHVGNRNSCVSFTDVNQSNPTQNIDFLSTNRSVNDSVIPFRTLPERECCLYSMQR